MINLRGSRFTDIMPENLASQLETQAFAYALGRQIEKLCAYADGLHIYAAAASMPEKILDVLAVELRTPAYNQSFSIEVKRALIEGTLVFYSHMGTPAACNQIIEIIFGSGRVEEWFDYGGDPHHFRAYVGDGGKITPEKLEEFRRVIAQVKRLSIWLDEIITVTALPEKTLHITPVLGPGSSVTTLPTLEPELPPTPVYLTPVLGQGLSVTALPSLESELSAAVTAVHPGAVAGSVMVTRLPPAEEFETVIPAAAPVRTAVALHSTSDTKLPFMKEEFL